MNIRIFLCLIPLLLAVVVTSGCGNKQEAARRATQVAAKVNADEITVHQVNNFLARSPNVTPEVAAQAKGEILDKLIDQQVAKQRAIEKKLDRLPNVMQAIEAARSEILARAYLEQIAAAQPKPTAGEVKKYYAEHPELFAQRRVFDLEEIVVPTTEGLAAGLKEQAAKARSMQDFVAWLKSQNAEFAENRGARAAEQIPLDLLPQLQAMKQGEIRLIEGGGRLNVFRLVAVQAAPVDEPTAAARIQQFLFNQRLAQAIAKELAQIKETSKIEYVGEFAAAAPPTKATPPDEKAQPAQPAQPPGPNFAKGVRGLR